MVRGVQPVFMDGKGGYGLLRCVFQILIRSDNRVYHRLPEYKSTHLEAVEGVDGSYVMRVGVRFSALGANFLVLIVCKHEQRKVERRAVQVLHAKMVSTGAQKGMLFSLRHSRPAPLNTRLFTGLHRFRRHTPARHGLQEVLTNRCAPG
jgi:hypothetical protein